MTYADEDVRHPMWAQRAAAAEMEQSIVDDLIDLDPEWHRNQVASQVAEQNSKWELGNWLA